jgi:hypothetical protein
MESTLQTAAFVAIMMVPGLRRLFDLSPLGPAEWAYLLGCLGLWLACVRLAWRRDVLGGFLGLKSL